MGWRVGGLRRVGLSLIREVWVGGRKGLPGWDRRGWCLDVGGNDTIMATLRYVRFWVFGVWGDTRIQLNTSFLSILTRCVSHPGKFTSINLSTIKSEFKQSATVRLRGGLGNTIDRSSIYRTLPSPAAQSSTQTCTQTIHLPLSTGI